jgi:hypothetical protein
MTSGQWQALASWHNAWLAADAAERQRLREQLARDAPELVVAADQLIADTRSLDGFLETPAFVLEANQLAAHYAAEPAGPAIFRRPRGPRRLAMAGAVLGLMALAGAAGFLLRRTPAFPERRSPLVRFALALPAGLDLLSAPVLSPDGQRVAFVVGTGGSSRLMVRDLGDEGALVVGGTDGATFPFWSPDGGWIGFSARGRLMKVSSTGGAPVVIDGAVGSWGGAWSPSGVVVFQPAVRNAGLQQVPETGGRPVAASLLDDAAGDVSHRNPAILPGGRTFLYCLESTATSRSGLYFARLDAPTQGVGTRLGDCLSTYVPADEQAGYLLAATGSHIEARHVDLSGLRVGEPHEIDIAPAVAPADGAALFTATSEVLAYAVAHTDPAAARQIGLVIGWRQLLDEDGRGAGLNLRARTRGPDPAPLSIPQTRLASVRSR